MSQRSDSDTAALRAVKGMNDVLPADAAKWQRFEEAAAGVARAYGYRRIQTPILEHAALFSRGIGQVTDIVEKEMYAFDDRADKDGNFETLALRPECTASVVRAAIEHHLLYDGPERMWSMGPMFRRERPQRGRSRQFHQFDIEALGFAGPDVDAEVILLAKRLFDDLGVGQLRLEINTIGQPEERARHRVALIEYLEANEELLDADARRRLHSNPLRILDTKNPAMQALVEAAPRIADFAGDSTRAHFDGVIARLKDAGVEAHVNPRLVRGLDYYNLTVFEWITEALGAQGTVCGGGRYDGLVAMLGRQARAGLRLRDRHRTHPRADADRQRRAHGMRRVRGASGRTGRASRDARCRRAAYRGPRRDPAQRRDRWRHQLQVAR